MELTVLKTGSAGNGYILRSHSGESLIIEAGVKLDQVKKALDFDLSGVSGCLVTHVHEDHSKYLKDYANAGIDCHVQKYMETPHHRINAIRENLTKFVGGFKIKPFTVKHDVPCLGFLIHHDEMGKLVFITDSYFCPYKFKGVQHYIVEANYSKKIIENKYQGDKEFLKTRVKSSHMSLETCVDMLKANDLTETKNIVLIHLSDTNSDEAYFKDEVQKATGKMTTIARDGLTIDL